MWKRKWDDLHELNRNLENDLRLLHNKHKKALTDLEEKYKVFCVWLTLLPSGCHWVTIVLTVDREVCGFQPPISSSMTTSVAI